MSNISECKCILVVGATAGIGRSLALSLRALPSKPTVIVTGRRQERLDELSKQGFETIRCDVDTTRENYQQFVESTTKRYPELDAVVFSAGVQHMFDFSKPDSVDIDKFVSELNINYIGIVTMITYLLPHFLELAAQGRPCFIIPITSGLAIIPGPWVPCYCATKAALHSFSMSLHEQLTGKNVHVLEIMPPLVESELHDHQGTTPSLSKFWMSLDDFTKNAMDGLIRGDACIPVGQVAASHERYEKGKIEIVHKNFEFGQKLGSN
ncbi:hypothetical protein JAAARDRAFT_54016 [Jaapia argillacea MUCL 33604]|uniref:NAD(P)-binding protein n=1 Tax=Jaapia argillacea MUCL 33604 TaxID=933084 RepID=A0A067Q9U5_9AGAM|nr:hypothetical protein JAAARDRAFT_54016 [Jaapia argillacea MUCL 33604]